MDNNNLTQQPPAVNTAPPQAPMSPQPPVPQVPISDASGDSKNVIVWLVIGLIVIALLVGGIFFFLSKQQAPVSKVQTVPSQAPAPSSAEDLEGDLNSINVDVGTDSDFVSIDQDLQQL